MAHKFYLRQDHNHGTERWTLYEAHRRGRSKVGTLKGWRLSVALPHIRKLVHRLTTPRREDLALKVPEEDGVRLALSFVGIRNLRKLERAENLCRQIENIGQEEAYYWYAKAFGHKQGLSGVRALRMLFSND